MNRETSTMSQVLRDLNPLQRQEVVAEALSQALEILSQEEQNKLQAMSGELSDRMRGMGPRTALEVLGAIGMLWVKQP